MEQDKVRAEFEAWVLRNVTGSTQADLFRIGDCYEWERLNWEFSAWKASREAVVVELPPSEFFDDGKNDYGYEAYAEAYRADATIAAIHAAGIRTR